MTQNSHFRVYGPLDGAGAPQRGTVTITRDGFFRVRPFRRKRVFELRLDDVATMVCRRSVFAEIARKKKERAKRKKERRR